MASKSRVQDAPQVGGQTSSEAQPEEGPEPKKKKTQSAFDLLMSPKPKPPAAAASKTSGSYASPVRHLIGKPDGLGVYLQRPETFPSTRVIYHNEHFVAVNDLYPKSSIHVLLLPRSPAHSAQHPFEALKDPAFLESVQKEVEKLKALVARELQRRFGAGSRSEARRQAVLNGDEEPNGEDGQVDGDGLPLGRDWAAEIITGVHARPSMSHLHVHVLSREMHSLCLKHRKHYNSFNTPFLVDVAEFPLAEDDPRLRPGEHYLRRDLVCWRCGANFKNKFKALKEHLEDEFDDWKKL